MSIRKLVVLPALLGIAAAGSLPAQGTMPSTVRVSATGEVQAAPDEAWVDLGVETQGATARAAADANAAAMQRVIDALVRAGVARADIGTQGFNVFPEYEHREDGTAPRIRGYRVTNVVSARTGQVAGVGTLIDAGLAAGANRVNGVRFGVKDAERYRAQALRDAVRRGRAEAETLAGALGVSLGQVMDVSTTFAPVHPVPVMMERLQMTADQAATPVEPGQQTISATVNLVYRIAS